MELLPVLVAMLSENERDEVLDILKHANHEALHSSLSQCFGNLGCALFGCANIKNMIDLEKFPPMLQPFSCTVCDKHVEPGQTSGKYQ